MRFDSQVWRLKGNEWIKCSFGVKDTFLMESDGLDRRKDSPCMIFMIPPSMGRSLIPSQKGPWTIGEVL